VFEVSDRFYGTRQLSFIETAALPKCMSERISELPDEELIRLASLAAQIMQLAGIAAGRNSGPYLSLAAACNCELVIRRARLGMS
jgi:hypothetical protein